MKKAFFLTLLICIFMTPQTSIFADQKEDVKITLNSRDKQFTNPFTADVTINFINNSLYNSQVFLSYHVYDDKDNELLWEGKRVPVKINAENISQATIDIDLSSVPGMSNIKYAKVKLDLVDEKNLLWYSTDPEIIIRAEEIIFRDSFSEKFITSLVYAVKDHPLIFIINTFFTLAFIAVYLWIRKQQGDN